MVVWNTEVRRQLLAERERRAAQATALQQAFDALIASSEDSNADDEHDPEGATIAFERSQLSAQLSRARDSIAEIDHALARAHDGAYGRCERCEGPISADRLEARPAATSCIGCASARG